MAESLTLFLDNDFEPEFDATRKSAATGTLEPAAGLALIAYLATTPQGPAIDPQVSIALAERSGTPGRYAGVIPGAFLRTHLATLLGTRVWLVVKSSESLEAVVPYLVSDQRILVP